MRQPASTHAVGRTKKPSKAPAVRAWVLPGKYGYPPSLEADQMSQLDISQ